MNYYITQSQAMHDVYPLLKKTKFPDIFRGQLKSFQINLGYKCNQSCLHCHVNAGPKRKEMMTLETIDQILSFIKKSDVKNIDLTGGAPELNDHFDRILADSKFAKNIAQAGKKRVLAEHTFAHRLQQTLDALK